MVTDTSMRRRVVWSSTIGNALEWFDFTVFGLFAGTIGRLFFPASNPANSLLAAYGLFAVSYFARPLGGLLFGVWADRVGRKRALITIVLSMAFATGLIGILPTYQMIGIAAPIVLLVARLIQGFSAGGEFGASTAMLVEFAPPGRRGFYASFQFVAQAIALVVGAALSYALNIKLSPAALASWGWRIPFLVGIIIGPIGFYLRRSIDETPDFKAFVAKRAGIPNTPLRDVLREYPRALSSLFLVIAGITAANYILIVFLPHFVASELHLRLADAQLGMLVFSVIGAAILPFTALLSDRLGRRLVMVPGIVLFIVASLYLAARLVAEPTNAILWTLQGSSLLMLFATGPCAALALEIFPVGVRSTGASIAYNFSVAIFGGLAPLVTGGLLQMTHDKFAPFYYLTACLVLSLAGLAILPRKLRRDDGAN